MTGSPAAGAVATDGTDPRRWQALAICLVGGFMVLLDISIVNVALPTLKIGLDASQSDLQWVLSGYALAFGLLLVPAGRFGDVRGRRSVFVGSLGLFTLASAACGAAQTSSWLIAARLLQGLAGGALTPQITALIQELFRGRERGKAFGWYGTVVGVSTAIGPLLGGVLIAIFGDAEGWRAVFYVNVPIGLAAMPIAWRLLPGPRRASQDRRHDYDPVGVVLLGSGAVVLLLPFVQERQWGTWKWLLLPLALALIGCFLLWDRRYARQGREPLVDLGLFRLRSYAFGVSLGLVYFAGFTPLFFVFTLYLQTGLAYAALAAGVATIPFAIGSAIASTPGGRSVDRFGRPLVAVGLVLVVIGFVGMLFAVRLAPTHGTAWATLVPLFVAGIGSGLAISPNQTLTLSEVPVAEAGTAGGLLQSGQRIGTAIGIAAVGAAFFAQVGATGGRDYASAFERGLLVSIAFVIAALLIAVADIVLEHRAGRREDRLGAEPETARASQATG